MDTIAFPYLFHILCVLPAFGVVSWIYLRTNEPPAKKKRHLLTICAQIWLLVYTLAAAAAEKIDLFPPKLPSTKAWLLGMLFIAVVLARVKLGLRRADLKSKQRLGLFLPENLKEFWSWMPVSVLAGLWEECAYRGAAYSLLVLMTRSTRFALVACVIAFALAHLYQGWKGAIEIGFYGVVSHMAVFLTGSLYLSIAVHATYDLLAGWLVMRLVPREPAVVQPEPLLQP